MTIVLFLGQNVKEYEDNRKDTIKQLLSNKAIGCELCFKPMAYHSSYVRGIKETGQKIVITMVWCSKCRNWHALLPDFLLKNKHYSGNEIESVIIDSITEPVNNIETAASEVTARRWIKEIGEKIEQAVSILKFHFGRAGQAVSEVAIDAGSGYNELEQVLEKAPSELKYSGNKLGLANLWLSTNAIPIYI